MAPSTVPSLALASARVGAGPAGTVEIPASDHELVMIHAERVVNATLRCDGVVHRRTQGPGDIDLIPSGVPATFTDEAYCGVLVVTLPHETLRAVAEELSADTSLSPHFHVRDARLSELGWAIERHRPGSGLLLKECNTLELASHLLVRHGSSPRKQQQLSRVNLARVIDHIESHLAEALSIQALSRLVDLQPTRFKELFRNSVGKPVHRYVVERRVRRARLLILEGRSSLAEIAAATGFAHRAHMSRWLKRVFAMGASDLARLGSR
jgi:AraC family transcriptional regulator